MKDVIRKLKKAVRLALVPLYRRGLFHGVGAAVEYEAVLAIMSQNATADVFDVGANCGQFSLLCRYWLPRAKMYAERHLSGY